VNLCLMFQRLIKLLMNIIRVFEGFTPCFSVEGRGERTLNLSG
jgi:hypothetical protein